MSLFHISPRLVYSAGIIFPIVCTSVVALRFYTQRSRGVGIRWDDWLTLPALAALIANCVAVIIGIELHGLGYGAAFKNGQSHFDAHDRAQTVTRIILWSSQLLQLPTLTFIKLSFVLWYRRLFLGASSRWYRWALNITIAVLIIWGVSFWLAYVFICPGHPEMYWTTLSALKTSCVNTTALYNSYGTSDVILDVVVFILPLCPLYNLYNFRQSSSRKRASIVVVFMLGAFSIIASILKMVIYYHGTAVQFDPDTDIPTLLTAVVYWGLVECGVALISCCIPICSVLLLKKLDHKAGVPVKEGSFNAQLDPSTQRQESGYWSIAVFEEVSQASDSHKPNEILVTKTFGTDSV